MKTIKSVKPNANKWDGPKGTVYYVSGDFDDGSNWSIGVQSPEKASDLIKTFSGMIGKPPEGYNVEPKMKDGKQEEYNGHPKWVLKPQQAAGGFRGGGGGGKTWAEAYTQSKEAFEAQQRSIQRSVALQRACEVSVAQKLFSAETIIDMADLFYAWLAPVPTKETLDSEARLSEFLKTLAAVNGHRKSSGLNKATADVVKAAILLRKWGDIAFDSWGDLVSVLPPDRLDRLIKAMDVNPNKFEREVHMIEEQA